MQVWIKVFCYFDKKSEPVACQVLSKGCHYSAKADWEIMDLALAKEYYLESVLTVDQIRVCVVLGQV